MRHSNGQVVFLFGEGNLDAKDLGGKGAGLGEMARLGVTVPPGFTVATTVARAFQEHHRFPERYEWQLQRGIVHLERQTGKRFGDPVNPLLVSVRSGARVSMPGMMDTVLNLGLNPKIVEGLAKMSGSKRFAWDSYRRFLTMFGDVVLGIGRNRFESILNSVKLEQGVTMDTELNITSLKRICVLYRKLIQEETGSPMPDKPNVQLKMAVEAVFQSWGNERAREYRRVHKIPDWWGTAANIQAMVFGNYGPDSGTGVVFSRNVATGAPGTFGEFLVNAQGEDVVAGIRTPIPISKMREWNQPLYVELERIVRMLENRYRDAVDVEFTVERGRLYILQVRVAKRTPVSSVTMAVHFVWEGLWTKEEAVARVTSGDLEAVNASVFEAKAWEEAVANRLLSRGLSASPGAAVGEAVFTKEEAIKFAQAGRKAVLIRNETSPDDLSGMLASAAIVTFTGGATSHAAVVARSLGKPAVVGASKFKIVAGEVISVDGSTGTVVRGGVPFTSSTQTKEVNIFLRWRKVFGPKWPSPRLHLAYVDESVNINQVLNDFYLVDAMALKAKGTSLEVSAEELKQKIHIVTAERFAAYLANAIAGELRHYRMAPGERNPSKVTKPSAYVVLRQKYKVLNDDVESPNRKKAQKNVIDVLRQMTFPEQVEFFHLAAEAFDTKGKWGSSFGGAKWGDIARAAQRFLVGELNHSAFADHTFDLQHNSGNVFDKHPMLSGNRDRVTEQLEAKKHATDVPSLVKSLSRFFDKWGTEVAEIHRKGEALGLWASAIVAKAA